MSEAHTAEIVDLTKFRRFPNRPNPFTGIPSSVNFAEIGDFFGLRRELAAHDQIRLKTLVGQALESVDEGHRAMIKPKKQFTVALAYSNDVRLTFLEHYLNGDIWASRRRFNDLVLKSRDALNGRRPRMFAQLGQIGIFGAAPNRPGQRFVGPVIVGEGKEQFDEDSAVFFQAIAPESNPTDMVRSHVHHLTLFKTPSEAAAIAGASALIEVGVPEIWTTLTKINPMNCGWRRERRPQNLAAAANG